jgi:Flp pilus assembly protein TadD
LVIHYEIPHLDTVAAALPWVLPVVGLMLLTVVLVVRRTAAGFVLTWMFAVLSPTLLVPIVTEIAVERRMYLPLAALVALAVGSGYLLVRRVVTAAHSPTEASLWVMVAAGMALIITYCAVDLRRLEAYADTVCIWQDALAYYPASNVINANLASELLVAGRPEEALTVSRQALTQGCDSRGIHNNLGASLTALGDRYGYQPGQLDEAVAQLNEALRISPDFEDALVNLAFALLKAGQPEQAAVHCTHALQLNPRNAQALYAQGTIFMALGKANEAAGYLQQAVEQDPRSAAAHYGLALVLLNGSQSQAARDHLQEALRLDPTLPEVHYALGGVLAAQGDLRGAAREYAAAAELRPAYAQAVNNLGVMQMNLGETDNAIRSFAEAVRRQPDYKEAQGNLERAQQVKQQQDGEQKQ